jgi:hypothetical protein
VVVWGDVHVIAHVDPTLGCAADVDGPSSILDVVAHQGAFVCDRSADCDGNGALDILGFICFHGIFVKGCA